jgi:tetratricopeptide (TPR) repeat protein
MRSSILLTRRLALLGVAALGLLALLLAPPAGAKKEKKKASFTVGQIAYKKLTEVQELMGADNFVEAKQVLDELAEKKLNDHERALVFQTRAYILSNQERYDGAIDNFEKCLALEALPPGAQLGTRYNLAQLYMMEERYEDGARELERWFEEAENPGASAYYTLATAYALDDRYDKALRPAETAVSKSDQPKEAWLQLLLTLYFEKKSYKKLASVLEQLVWRFPKRSYWLQLAAIYGELGRDQKSLAVLELAYQQEMLTTDSELRRLAQMYLYHELPYRAARVMEEALDEGLVKSDARGWELLANSWVQAREYEKSIPALQRAAELADTGELYMRLGQIHLERQNWAQAEKALTQALGQGKLEKRGKTWVLLGVTRYSAGKPGPALEAFGKARDYESTRRSATQWITHLERERARVEADAGSDEDGEGAPTPATGPAKPGSEEAAAESVPEAATGESGTS